MTTLTDFLLARIVEDEAASKAAAEVEGADLMLAALPTALFGGLRVAFPARVLAECEAKRRIVEEARDYSPELAEGDNGEWAFDTTLRLLALPYAGHADYEEGWKP